MLSTRLIISVFFLFVLTGLSYAQAPVPESKNEKIGQLKDDLKKQSAAKEKLEEKAKILKQDLKDKQKELVSLGKSVQSNESILQDLEHKIQSLETDKSAIEKDLRDDERAIASLVLALQRLRRIPPEALIARPDAPIKTAQSAMLMRDIMPKLSKKARALKDKLQGLQAIRDDLTQKKDTALARSQDLKQEQIQLANLVSDRETILKSTQKDLKVRAEMVQKISLQANNLKDLVKKLDEEQNRQAKRSRKTSQASLTIPQTMPKPGEPRLPISGIIRVAYDAPDAFGAPSKGIKIEGRANGLVVAPMGGAVRFAGFFKNYGNLIIVEHKNGYHSLIAGLEKINTFVGQSVSAGEPLGFLKPSIAGNSPTLYYELRYNGSPLNPAKKFSGMS